MRYTRFLPILLILGVLLAQSANAAADNCPNAVLRSGPSSRLPDCRAYEMVTPPYKEGFPVYEVGFAEDGEHALGESFGVFSGSENSEVGGVGALGDEALVSGGSYLFTRESSGWATTAITPPAWEFPSSLPFDQGDLSSDLTTSLWVATTPAQEAAAASENVSLATMASIYLRKSNGPVETVGSLLPPSIDPHEVNAPLGRYYKPEGASDGDFSHVFYSMSNQRWPGDATQLGAESLYEYVGTGNDAPFLVGVNGGAGSADLISTCGTGFEGASESGAEVLFAALPCGSSPAVRELYERIGGEEPGAHTVAISEPSKEDCAACDTEPALRQAASVVTFQEGFGVGVKGPRKASGLSNDGQRVFFTTSQPLLGDDTSKNLYEYDAQGEAGRRVLQISSGDSTVSNPTADFENVVSISPDGSHIYFFASGVLTKIPNDFGQQAEAGQSNLYLYQRDAQYPNGRIAFVLSGGTAEVSTVSQNGRYMAFSSRLHFTPDDLSDTSQEFEYDSETGGFVRISIGQNGFNEDGNTGTVTHATVVDDGAAFFESANPLVPQATNGLTNIYEYRAGNVNLISDGQEPRAASALLGYVSPSGRDVFFDTFEQLVPKDGDNQEDIYDARAGGGFSEPSPSPQCVGDACQGPLSGAPVLLSPGSEFQAGGENFTPSSPSAGATPKSKAKPEKKIRRKAKKKPKDKSTGKHKHKARKSAKSRRRQVKTGGRR